MGLYADRQTRSIWMACQIVCPLSGQAGANPATPTLSEDEFDKMSSAFL